MALSKNSPSAITHRMLKFQAKELAQLSSNVSIALNDIAEIKHYLHSDVKTNQMGTVELAENNEVRIIAIEQREKIYVAKAGIIYTLATAFGGGIVWVFTRFFINQ